MIEFQNVSKIFKTKECEVKALENVSLTIEDGDIYGIIGFSGWRRYKCTETIKASSKEEKNWNDLSAI